MAEKNPKGETPATTTEPVVEEELKATETEPQEEKFDEARALATIKAQRESERAKEKELKSALKRLAELEELEKEREEAQLSELDKAKKHAAELEAALAARDHEALQRKVADAVGLPAILASRLIGGDEEAMTEDAKKLLETLPKGDGKRPAANINPTNPAGGSREETPAQKRERLLGGHNNVFDPNFVRAKGGGIQIAPEE